jgi:HEAT repeat protein
LANRDYRAHRRLRELLTNDEGCFDRILALRRAAARPDALPMLTTALSDRSALVRQVALIWLTDRGPAAGQAIDRLLPCLNDPERQVRVAAVAAIDVFGLTDPDAAGALARAMVDTDRLVAWQASRVLTLHGPESAAALPVLAQLVSSDDNSRIRSELVAVLRAIGDEALPVLADHLHPGDWLLTDACLILAEHPDAAIPFVPQLTAALDEPLTAEEERSVRSLLSTLAPTEVPP